MKINHKSRPPSDYCWEQQQQLEEGGSLSSRSETLIKSGLLWLERGDNKRKRYFDFFLEPTSLSWFEQQGPTAPGGEQNQISFGLTDEEGNPINQAIEECSKVANWNPGGGAPKTPTG